MEQKRKENSRKSMDSLPDSEIPCVKVTPSKEYRLKQKGAFIKGPIDLGWISSVAKLPGKALNVGMALMWLSGLNKSKVGLKLTKTIYRLFNVSRTAALKALNGMEKEGLVSIQRSPGMKNRITILEAPPPMEEEPITQNMKERRTTEWKNENF